MRNVFPVLFFALSGACSSAASSTATEAGVGDGGFVDARDAVDAGRGLDAHDASTTDGRGATDGGSLDVAVPHAEGGDGSRPEAASPMEASTDAAADVRHDAPSEDANGGGTCGATTCYAGQSCVSNQCAFTDCSGALVPGDYATLQAALTALSDSAAGGTICLAAQAYPEAAELDGPGPIIIQGVGRGRSTVDSLLIDNVALAGASATSVTLRGLTLHGLTVNTTKNSNVDVAVTATTVDTHGIAFIAGSTTSGTLTLDGVDVSGTAYLYDETSASGAIAFSLGPNESRLIVENSYIHGTAAAAGLLLDVSFGGGIGAPSISIVNSTLVSNGTAISEGDIDDDVTSSAKAVYFNDLILDNTVGIDGSGTLDTTGDNAFYGNTTNYAGSSVPGPGAIETNPMVDTSTPPGLLPGSPCRGTGNSMYAPAHDFYGRPRGSSVDIGAVQSQ